MTNSLDDQLEEIVKSQFVDSNLVWGVGKTVASLKALIREREAEILDEVKTILQTEIDDAKELEDNSIRIIVLGWLLNAQAQVAELERRHDG